MPIRAQVKANRRYRNTRHRQSQRANMSSRVNVITESNAGGLEVIPSEYVLDKLKLLGPTLFNKPANAECRLLLGITLFYGHELFLSSASRYFRNLYIDLWMGVERKDVKIIDGILTINLPLSDCHAIAFEGILRWVRIFLCVF